MWAPDYTILLHALNMMINKEMGQSLVKPCWIWTFPHCTGYPISWYGPNFTRALSLLGLFIPGDGICAKSNEGSTAPVFLSIIHVKKWKQTILAPPTSCYQSLPLRGTRSDGRKGDMVSSRPRGRSLHEKSPHSSQFCRPSSSIFPFRSAPQTRSDQRIATHDGVQGLLGDISPASYL